MSKLNHYKAALYLCAAIAVMDAIWVWVLVIPRMQVGRTIIPLLAPPITVLGLLLLSNVIRWLGGVFMVIWAAAFLWPLISDGTAALSRPNGAVIFLYYLCLGALNLLTAALLLFSKQFSYEFAKRRESAPKYIGHLRLLLIGAIIAAMLVATSYDIVKLASAA